MSDDLPLCPYCNRKTRVSKRLMGTYYVNEGMSGPWHYIQKKIYKHQVICNKCFMRGPLMEDEHNAILAFGKLL